MAEEIFSMFEQMDLCSYQPECLFMETVHSFLEEQEVQ